MASITHDIKDKLSKLNVLEKIIVVNVIVYLTGYILTIILSLPKETSLSWLELPSRFSKLLVKPWSIITYISVSYTHLTLPTILLV